METVTITGLDRVRDPRPTLNGHLILAYFTAEIGVFTIRGCALVRTARGGLAAWLPTLQDAKAKANRHIALNDEQTRHSLLQHALQMYRRMGGTDAEWIPRDSIERAEEALLNILPPPIKREIPVTVRNRQDAA